eukprot:247078-Rhodomonas_salina.1
MEGEAVVTGVGGGGGGSKQSGAEYSVPAILHLMLRIQVSSLPTHSPSSCPVFPPQPHRLRLKLERQGVCVRACVRAWASVWLLS